MSWFLLLSSIFAVTTASPLAQMATVSPVSITQMIGAAGTAVSKADSIASGVISIASYLPLSDAAQTGLSAIQELASEISIETKPHSVTGRGAMTFLLQGTNPSTLKVTSGSTLWNEISLCVPNAPNAPTVVAPSIPTMTIPTMSINNAGISQPSSAGVAAWDVGLGGEIPFDPLSMAVGTTTTFVSVATVAAREVISAPTSTQPSAPAVESGLPVDFGSVETNVNAAAKQVRGSAVSLDKRHLRRGTDCLQPTINRYPLYRDGNGSLFLRLTPGEAHKARFISRAEHVQLLRRQPGLGVDVTLWGDWGYDLASGFIGI